MLVVVLLGDTGQQTPHADAVGAHDDRFALFISVNEEAAQGVAVARAELEDVADLDPARRAHG